MQQVTRKVQKYGDSHYICLPDKWAIENNIERGDKLNIFYNGVVKIVPAFFGVEITGDAVFFIWKKEKAGLKLTEVKKIVHLHGLDEALQLIKQALIKRNNYPESFPIDLMKERLIPIVYEFI